MIFSIIDMHMDQIDILDIAMRYIIDTTSILLLYYGVYIYIRIGYNDILYRKHIYIYLYLYVSCFSFTPEYVYIYRYTYIPFGKLIFLGWG